MKASKEKISIFSEDFGGTNLDKPLEAVLNKIKKNDPSKLNRIFVLTDGCTSNRQRCLDLVKNHCDTDICTKVYSFGMGSGADQHLVT